MLGVLAGVPSLPNGFDYSSTFFRLIIVVLYSTLKVSDFKDFFQRYFSLVINYH